MAQRVSRSIALLFHDRDTRRESHFTPGKDPVPIVQEAGWAPGSILYILFYSMLYHVYIVILSFIFKEYEG